MFMCGIYLLVHSLWENGGKYGKTNIARGIRLDRGKDTLGKKCMSVFNPPPPPLHSREGTPTPYEARFSML